jgi:hypothetical protein
VVRLLNGESGRVDAGGRDSIWRERRVLGVDLPFGHVSGEAVEDDVHRDARAADPSLTVPDRRVGVDGIERLGHHGFRTPDGRLGRTLIFGVRVGNRGELRTS